MNAIVETAPLTKTAPHPTHKLRLLLRREYWEHKGGFFWAPIWAGAISLLLTLMALIAGEVVARRAIANGSFHGDSRAANGISVNNIDLSVITANMSPETLRHWTDTVRITTASAMLWPMLVLGFVVFFYCLGSLYDERKDRSVLFWKSLPVSDRDTVLAKTLSALVVAPITATLVGVACMVGYLLVLSVFVLIHHGNPLTLLWSPTNLLASAGLALAAIPIYALWALPSVGWLLLCSAWARTKPFLWAIMIPVFAGVLVSWFNLMNAFNLGSGWFWKNVVGHLLGGVFPGSFFAGANLEHFDGHGIPTFPTLLHAVYSPLATPQLWIGVAAGAVMIFAAIRLRRWRDEG